METQDYIKETDRQLNNTNFYKQLIQTMCLPVDHQLQISVNMPKSYAKKQQICKQDWGITTSFLELSNSYLISMGNWLPHSKISINEAWTSVQTSLL